MGSRVRRYSIWVLAAVCAVRAEANEADGHLAARVNGVGISLTTLNRTFDAYANRPGRSLGGMFRPSQYKVLRHKVLELLIAQELLWQEAQRLGMVASREQVDRALEAFIASHPDREDYVLWLRQTGMSESAYAEDLKRRLSVDRLIQREIPNTIPISDEEVHEFYVANRDRFSRPEQVRARHILLKVDPSADEATRRLAQRRIGELLVEAQSGADFAELAKQHSQGPSGPKGGDLGFFARGQMVAAFEAAAFSLESGQISDVVETPYGYHIIKLVARREAGFVAEAVVREQIRRHLRSTKTDAAIEQRIEMLRAEAQTEVFIP